MAARTVLGTLVVLTFVLQLFVLSEFRRESQRTEELAATFAKRSDLAMLRPLRIDETLQHNCMKCHTDRKFKERYGAVPSEMVERVRSHPGSEDMPPAEAERVAAAMILARCTICHDEPVIGELALRTREDRLRYLRGKVRRTRPVFEANEASNVMWALDVLLDEPYRRTLQDPSGKPRGRSGN